MGCGVVECGYHRVLTSPRLREKPVILKMNREGREKGVDLMNIPEFREILVKSVIF